MRISLLPCLLFTFFISAAQEWKPAKVSLTSSWGEKVNSSNAWQEYPRPQMVRTDWMNLNGIWNYAVLPKGQTAPKSFDGKILVPFCIESSLSGVGKPLMPSQELWYERSFRIPKSWSGKEILLRFDAVDWETKLWVNGKKAGEHKGGSDPFSFNISPYITDINAEQKIVLGVWDPTDTELQARGKQVLNPRGIWYTAVSGIWQTVWLEPLPKKHIDHFVPTPDIDKGLIHFNTSVSGLSGNEKLRLKISQAGKLIKDTTAKFSNKLSISIPNAKWWSPESPSLYNVTVELISDKTDDQFESYFAMRKIALGDDEKGYKRLMLNNKPVFQYGTLDQGWWPEGLLTPPSDEAMLYDLVKLKEMGFNMVRKHIKVEPSRYYYHADTMGLILWQDMPSGFAGPGPSHVAFDAKEDWKRPAESAEQFETEWKAIMDHLRFFPSIVMWVPLNEGWGQYDTKRIAELTKNYDPSRLVDAPSGWTDRGVGDVNDAHQYPGPGMEPPSANKGRAIVLGEFGGLGLVVKDHIWNPNKRNWGYKTYHGNDTLITEYKELIYNLQGMIPRGLAAAIYTQTTDVEGEVNGFMTYDRKVMKIPVALLKELHAPLYEKPEGNISFINKQNETDRDVFQFYKGKLPASWTNNVQLTSFAANTEPVLLKKGESVYAYQDIDLKEKPEGLGMKLYGFGDAKVYINGTLVWQEDKIRTKRHYDDINLTNKINLLKHGKNRVLVECTDATQDTNFDFGLYRLDK